MDIGSGKITKKEKRNIPHHLLGVANPRRAFSVAQYQKLANKALEKITKSGHLPIVCGGSHFYIQALVENLNLPQVEPNPKLRRELEKLPTKKLFAKLKKLDKTKAENIDPNNRVRLIRAVEIALNLKGEAFRSPKPRLANYRWLILTLEVSDKKIKENIKIRLKKRLEKGMVKEVEKLKKSGVSWKRLESFGLEYRAIARYLQNKISKEEMVREIEVGSWQFARRQKTWLRKIKPVWIKNYKEAEKLVSDFLLKSGKIDPLGS